MLLEPIFCAWVSDTENKYEVGYSPIGNEGLASIDNVFVAFPHCAGGSQEYVTSRTRFGNAATHDGFAGRDHGKVGFLLFLCAEMLNDFCSEGCE